MFRGAKSEHTVAPPSKVGSQTATLAILLAVAIGIGLLKVVAAEEPWPYSPWESAMFVFAIAFIGWSIWREIRKAEVAVATTGEWTMPKIDATPIRNPSGTIFLSVVAIFAFLVHAGLAGTANGEDILSGCEFARTVRFNTPSENVTTDPLVLVLHRGGFFYVLDSTNHIQVIPDANVVATYGWKEPTRKC